MAILGTLLPFLLLEPFSLYLSVLQVEWMHLFHPFEKIVKVLLPKKCLKIEKLAILSVMLAILGHFLRVLVTNRTSWNSLWCFIFLDIRFLRLNILKNRENGHIMHQNGHIRYVIAILVAGTFWLLSKRALFRMGAHISPV